MQTKCSGSPQIVGKIHPDRPCSKAMAQFVQEDGRSSTSIERAVVPLCHEKSFHASLSVKMENNGPGDRSGEHTGLR